MKVTSPRVSVLLRTSKRPNKQGEYPIYLRCCYGGTKEKALGVSCKPSDWSEKLGRVKASHPHAKILNTTIEREYIALQQRILELGDKFSIALAFVDSTSPKRVNKTISDFIDAYCEENHLKPNTVGTWKTLKYNLDIMKEGMLPSELNPSIGRSFVSLLAGRKSSDGHVRIMCAKLSCLSDYLIQKGVIHEAQHPFSTYNFRKHFKSGNRHYIFPKEVMDSLIDYVVDELIEVNGNMWHYRKEVDNTWFYYKHPFYARYFFVLSYLLQGLAPIDLIMLAKSQLTVAESGDKLYYAIDTKRAKTNIAVKIRLPRKVRNIEVLIGCLFFFSDTKEYMLTPLEGSNQSIENKSAVVFHHLRLNLRKWVDDTFNTYLAQNKLETIDTNKLTLYTARHLWASYYFNTPNATPAALATLLGRSVNTISAYIKELSNESELANAVDAFYQQ